MAAFVTTTVAAALTIRVTAILLRIKELSMKDLKTRVWLSPLTFLTFLVIGITGLLMLFHVRVPAVKVLHELVGIGFVIVGTVHLVLNWRVFFGYFRHNSARLSLGLGLLLCGALVVLGLNHREEGHRDPPGCPSVRSAVQLPAQNQR
jgi:hypothetical protein